MVSKGSGILIGRIRDVVDCCGGAEGVGEVGAANEQHGDRG